MTWVRIDDGAPLHSKLLEAGPEAAWLWVCGLAFCNRSVTDGVIRKAFLPALYPSGAWSAPKLRALSARLVAVRLWHEKGDEFHVHDYEIQQEEALKERVEARREYERSRKAAARAKEMSGTMSGTNAGQGPGQTGDNVPGNGNSRPRGGTGAPARSRGGARDPGPSRPDPTPTESGATDDSSGPAASALDRARSLLRTGYTDRYRRETRDAWMGAAKAHEHIGACAAWVADAGEDRIEVRAAALLDGMFADPWMREHRWPWGAAANDPAKYGSASAPGAPPLDPDRAELARLDAALNAARTRGDHDEVDRVRAEQRAFLDRVQRRTA